MSAAPRNLEIESQQAGAARIVRLRGEIDLRSSPLLRDHLLELSERREPHVVIDLTDVVYIDSSGVGTMVEFKRRTDRTGGRIALVGLQPRVRSVFEVTRLDKFFVIRASLAEAVDS